MLLKYVVVILLTLHVAYAEVELLKEDSNITSIKDTHKDLVQRRQHDLENSINENINILGKTVVDTLDKYLNGKLDLVQKQTNDKINSLEENIPENFEGLAQINEKVKKLQNDVSQIMKTIEDVTVLENNSYDTLTNVQRVEEIVREIKPALSDLNTKISEDLGPSTDIKIYALEKKIVEFENVINNEFRVLENTLSQNLSNTFGALIKPSTNEADGVVEPTTVPSEVVGPVPVNKDYGQCVKLEEDGYDFKPIGIESLNHTTIKYQSDGSVSLFETHLAIKGEYMFVHIQLSTTNNASENEKYYLIDFVGSTTTRIRSVYPDPNFASGVNMYETLYNGDGVPLSEFRYAPIGLKISDGVLELKREGTSSSIVHYKDERLKQVKYIGFTSWPSHRAEFIYSCPPGFHALYQERRWHPGYSPAAKTMQLLS